MYHSYANFMSWSFNPQKVFTDQTEMGEMMTKASIEIEG
jgi:hypothetical protein